MFQKRTDLAVELREMHTGQAGANSSGIAVQTKTVGISEITHIDVTNAIGAQTLGKPMGTYVTLALPENWLRDDESVYHAALAIAGELAPMLPKEGAILIVGLGNRAIIADAVGPAAIESIIVTRHLLEQFPQEFHGLRAVCAISTGVLGLTGIETAEIVKGVCNRVKPAAIIAIDALCSRSTARLCRTFQLSDTGITPGGGVAGGRTALDKETTGVPVIALGVPTVVDAMTLAMDILEHSGEQPETDFGGMLVTPKDIDALVKKSGKVIGYAINLALQGEMSVSEMEQFLE